MMDEDDVRDAAGGAAFDDENDDDDQDDRACPYCGGTDEDGYEACEWAGDAVYVPGPGSEDAYGCPYLTGTF